MSCSIKYDMDTFPNKKLNPYLYPFKMKSDIPHLYPPKTKFPAGNAFCHKEQLLHIGMLNEIATNTVFQPSMIPVLNMTDHIEKERNKDSSFQTKPNSAVPNATFSDNSTVFELLKTLSATFERPDIAAINVEKSQPINIPQNGTNTCIKGLIYKDVALEIPMVLTFVSPEANLRIMPRVRSMYTVFQKPIAALEKPKAMYLDFRLNTLQRSKPKEISWTRIDVAQKKLDQIPTWMKVVMGVVCGMIATAAVHPLDVVKVRLQLFPKKVTTLYMLQRILACEGPSGLYAGLTAGILRQLTYTGARLTVYHSLYANYRDTYGKSPDFHERMRIAVVAGLAGAFMGVPSEVALVRMIEVRRLRRSQCSPPCSTTCKKVQRPEGAIRQLLRVARREGVATWWRGVVPTLVRSVFVTSAQVGVYTEIREAFTKGDYVYTGPYIHFYTAGISSVFSAILSLPVDQVKTRYQSYQERHCRGMDILKEMLRTKGVKYLWKGLLPYYVRQAVHTMITYVALDQLIDAYVNYLEVNKHAVTQNRD